MCYILYHSTCTGPQQFVTKLNASKQFKKPKSVLLLSFFDKLSGVKSERFRGQPVYQTNQTNNSLKHYIVDKYFYNLRTNYFLYILIISII